MCLVITQSPGFTALAPKPAERTSKYPSLPGSAGDRVAEVQDERREGGVGPLEGVWVYWVEGDGEGAEG